MNTQVKDTTAKLRMRKLREKKKEVGLSRKEFDIHIDDYESILEFINSLPKTAAAKKKFAEYKDSEK